MLEIHRKFIDFRKTLISSGLLVLLLLAGPNSGARADEADAKGLLKAMSDYLASQKAFSFSYDTNLEVVTKDHQKLLLASSGKAEVGRPDKMRITRTGGDRPLR